MKKSENILFRKIIMACLVGGALLLMTACGKGEQSDVNLVRAVDNNDRFVNLYTPTEKSKANLQNVARSAQEKTYYMAEQQLGLKIQYSTYTAENYKDKSYDDVALARARSNLDDLYLLNPDVIQTLGEEERLMDLSELECAKNLRDVVKTANTVNGKLVAIPQEVVAYGLFINKDMFDQYALKLPETPEDFLECCRVFKENGIETPVGSNRWWLETFVLAQAYADLYNGGDTEAQISALNSGESKYSNYIRSGFEFLQKMIDLGYIDAKRAFESEAIEGEREDFLAQKTPIVMAYWSAANAETAYGNPDFNMLVIGFPSSLGQMPVISMTGYSVGLNAEHAEDALSVMEIILSDEALQVYAEANKVISPSKNVKVDCIPALKPLNDKIEENVYVLGSNAGMKLEQWGNTCLVVRKLLNGATVDECMAEFDKLQEESLEK